MLINLRNALMTGKRLPYDAEVEYLQSTGTQWIDTGIRGAGSGFLATTFQPLNVGSASTYWRYFGASNGGTQTVRTISYNGGGRTLFENGYTQVVLGSSRGEVYTIQKTGYNVPSGSTVGDNNFQIFGYNGATNIGNVRFYSFSLWNSSGVLVRDFIPVRKGTVGYLYDRVSGKLFGNAGTGDFVLGQDVVPVEYIESHGTEWIDTGTLIEMTDRVDCTFELLAYGNVTLAGGRIDASTSSWVMWAYTDTGRCIRFDLLSNGYGNVVQSITPTIGREYKVSKIGTRNIVDGVEVRSNSSVAYTPSRPCYLFAMNNGGTASFIGNCRVKDFSIGSKLKYRPVRVGTEGAMMDTLTRRIYRNAGTGAFTYGNDLKYPIPSE